MENGNCQQCSANCSKCLSLNYCLVCDDGYFQILDSIGDSTGICGVCASPCLTCSLTADTCTTCLSGY